MASISIIKKDGTDGGVYSFADSCTIGRFVKSPSPSLLSYIHHRHPIFATFYLIFCIFIIITNDAHREKCNDIRIKIVTVSRNHVKIVMDENGQFVLNNLSQSNPTCLNSEKVLDNAVLKNGDTFSIHDRQFLFRMGKQSHFLSLLFIL